MAQSATNLDSAHFNVAGTNMKIDLADKHEEHARRRM